MVTRLSDINDSSVGHKIMHRRNGSRPGASFPMFLGVFLIILSILLVPVTIFSLNQAIKEQKSRAEQYLKDQRQQATTIFGMIESQLIGMNDITLRIYRDEQLADDFRKYRIGVSDASGEQLDLFRRIRITHDIGNFLLKSSFITNILIVSKKMDFLVDSRGWFSLPDYQSIYYPTLEENLSDVLSKPIRYPIEIVMNGEGQNSILLASSMYGINSVFIVFLSIDIKKMTDYFDRIHHDVFRTQAVLLNDTLLYGDEESRTGGDFERHSITTNFDFHASFFEPANGFGGNFLVLDFILIFVFCSIISLILSIVFYSPLYRIYSKVRYKWCDYSANVPHFQLPHPIRQFESYLDELQIDQERLSRKISRYQVMLRDNEILLRFLLMDRAEDYLDVITEIWPWFSLQGCYCIMLANSSNMDPMSVVNHADRLDETLRRLSLELPFEYHCTSILTNDYAIVLSFQDENPSQTILCLKDRIREVDGVTSYFGTSGTGVLGIQNSYIQARRNQLAYQSEFGGTSFFFPIKVELKLVCSLKSANAAQSRELLELIFSENARLSLSEAHLWKLYQVIFETFERYARDIGFDITAYKEHFVTAPHADLGIARDVLLELCGAVSEFLVETAGDETGNLAHQLYEYVKANFSDPGISVASVADKFQISRNTLSKEFKRISSLTLPELVNMIRITEAVSLMQQQRFTLSQIAQMVGFCSYVTFQRAFVKNMSVSPSEFSSMSRLSEP